MTVETCYIKIGGNYTEAIGRFKTDDRIKKFIELYLKDTSAVSLDNAFAQEDYTAAFMAAHTLKGVLGNMAFTQLGTLVSDLTEYLRNGADINSAKKMYPLVKEKIQEVDTILKEFVAE